MESQHIPHGQRLFSGDRQPERTVDFDWQTLERGLVNTRNPTAPPLATV
jgi:hypothetical protein